jgi:hypothetical protein
MSNFTFLTTDWPGLFVPAREAEQHVNSAPGRGTGRGTLLAIWGEGRCLLFCYLRERRRGLAMTLKWSGLVRQSEG